MDFKFLAFVLLFVSKISLEQLQLQHAFLFSCFRVAFRPQIHLRGVRNYNTDFYFLASMLLFACPQRLFGGKLLVKSNTSYIFLVCVLLLLLKFLVMTWKKQHELHFSCMRVASTIEIPGNDLEKATHMLSFNQICCFSSTNGRLLRGLIKVHRRRLLLICKANQ